MKSQKYIAFSYPDFRNLWFANFISTFGSKMQSVALLWQIYEITHSPIALGVVGLVRTIPIIIFSLIGGSIADRLNRKHIMLMCQIVQGVLALILAITTITQSINVYVIYTLAAIGAITSAFNTPAEQALVPNLVKKEHLANALSLNTIVWQIANIVGPTIAGFMIAHTNLSIIYGFNALSFGAVILALLHIRTTIVVTKHKHQNHLEDIKEGIRFVKGSTIIWSTMILDFFSTLFASATALLPVFAKDILDVGPQGLGILYAAPSIGAVSAGFIIAHIGVIKHQGKILLGSIALYAVATIIFGFSKIFFISFLALVLIGVGDSISTIIRNTIRQSVTPDYLRGRMTAINMIFFMGGPELGEFEAGLLAAHIGANLSVVTGGIGTLFVVFVVGKYVHKLRNYTQ